MEQPDQGRLRPLVGLLPPEGAALRSRPPLLPTEPPPLYPWHNLPMLLAACTFLCLATSSPQGSATEEDLAAARIVIQELPEELAEEFAEQLRMEASWNRDFRSGLQAYLLKKPPRDPGTWPMVESAPLYDPKRHCPAQPIPRKRLTPRDSRSIKALERFRISSVDPELDPGWIYDYASRELRRTKHWNSPKRLLRNGLLGSPPDQDLALAVLELHLDSGEQQATLTAFSHAYADRTGTVFPGVTLYDAWSSGAQLEMPDVECLGIVHDLLDDWKTWKAPVRKQESLYDAIKELFVPARQHRGLRHALATSYLVGAKKPLEGYASNHLQIHALWEDCASTPPALASRLPDAGGWRKFLEDWGDVVGESATLQKKAQVRAASLERSAAQTQALVLRILRENELLAD